MKIFFKLLLVVAIIAAAAELWQQQHATSKAEHEAANIAAPVATASAPHGVGSLGRIEPRSRVIELSHDAGPEGVRIGELLVSEGQHVSKSEVIAIFSDADRKQSKLKVAQARIPALEARIAAETATLQFSKREYERASAMVKASAVSKSRYDETEKNYRQTQSNVEALRAELESAKAELALAEEELKQSTLLSPIDGTVIRIMAWPGERVGNEGVVMIADLTQMDVVAEIYERDMPRVAAGQQAEIRVPGMEEVFTGTVREVGYLVRKNDLNDTDPLADRDNRVVEVRISLESDTAEKLKHLIYMQVDVRLL